MRLHQTTSHSPLNNSNCTLRSIVSNFAQDQLLGESTGERVVGGSYKNALSLRSLANHTLECCFHSIRKILTTSNLGPSLVVVKCDSLHRSLAIILSFTGWPIGPCSTRSEPQSRFTTSGATPSGTSWTTAASRRPRSCRDFESTTSGLRENIFSVGAMKRVLTKKVLLSPSTGKLDKPNLITLKINCHCLTTLKTCFVSSFLLVPFWKCCFMIYGATGRSCLAEKFILKLFTFLEVFYSDQIVELNGLKVYCFKFQSVAQCWENYHTIDMLTSN